MHIISIQYRHIKYIGGRREGPKRAPYNSETVSLFAAAKTGQTDGRQTDASNHNK